MVSKPRDDALTGKIFIKVHLLGGDKAVERSVGPGRHVDFFEVSFPYDYGTGRVGVACTKLIVNAGNGLLGKKKKKT